MSGAEIEMAEEYEVTSFSSVPKDLIDEVRRVAEQNGITVLREVYEKAINQLHADLDAGLQASWMPTRPGHGRTRETVRLSPDVAMRLDAMAKQHRMRKTVIFLEALVRWLEKNGVNYDL